jgi:hypothetical protein
MPLEPGPVVLVNGSVLVDEEPAGSTEDVLQAQRLRRIDPLFTLMREKREAWVQKHPGQAWVGRALLVVDRRETALVVKSVFQTIGFAGFPNSAFVVRCEGHPGRLGLLPARARIPGPGAGNAAARSGESVVSGRIPPEVIQGTIRRHYAGIRDCYLSALELHPELTGRIAVRFVISREGLVTEAALAQSDLPAALNECILDIFRGIEFAKPEGGIVTVVYPLKFAPE